VFLFLLYLKSVWFNGEEGREGILMNGKGEEVFYGNIYLVQKRGGGYFTL
jgi:hypothetical protein